MKATRIESYPTEIIPGLLFLGDMSHATSYDRLRELQISHVLSIHTEPLKLPKSFVHMYIELEDAPSADIAQHFQQTYEFIEAAKCAQKRVLIHCGAGASRSATVCAAYLMRTKHWGLNDALNFLRDQRSKVNPNPGFVSALHEYSDLLRTERVNVHIQTGPSSSLWHLDVLKKADLIGSLLLDKESISFGRSADCTVILDHMSISRKHAVLTKQENGEFLLVDNQSTHGTFINGKMLKLATILKRGDEVQFGGSSRSYVLCDKNSCL
ncbi:hypothetical protein KP509_03G012200 [Ceratopteris richardii]|nr:hypothetical protein KP509_03G012200 [Ceratopteris richardii]